MRCTLENSNDTRGANQYWHLGTRHENVMYNTQQVYNWAWHWFTGRRRKAKCKHSSLSPQVCTQARLYSPLFPIPQYRCPWILKPPTSHLLVTNKNKARVGGCHALLMSTSVHNFPYIWEHYSLGHTEERSTNPQVF